MHHGFETAGLLDRGGLRGEVALLHRLLVGEERCRVEVVGLGLLFLEAVFRLHPLIVRCETLLGDEDVGGVLEVGKRLEALTGMGDQDLGVLLENRGDDDGRDVLLHGGESLNHVAAHVEIDAADRQGMRLLACGPPGMIFTSRLCFLYVPCTAW